MTRHIAIDANTTIGNDLPFTLIAGPCQIESYDHALGTAQAIKEICDRLEIKLIYKSSFDKANRTSLRAARGVGMDEGLKILQAVKTQLGVPVLTDVHLPEQCATVAEIADVLQIPAFLCRQTDLLVAAAKTGRAINVKKGQFLSPAQMRHVADKIAAADNEKIMLCERGASFGYDNLVSDMRSLEIMKNTRYPVIFDATHSVQTPGSGAGSTGGMREFIVPLGSAALACGVAGIFAETHPDPDNAPSDGPCMIPLGRFESVLRHWKNIDRLVKTTDIPVLN